MKRRGRSPTPRKEIIQDDPLDEQDQQQLIESLEQEAAQQTRQFQLFFSIVGSFAILVALSYPFLCPTECSTKWISCGIHSLYSAINHGLMILSVSRDDINSRAHGRWFYALSLYTIIPFAIWLLLANFDLDREHFHLGLIIGNVVTWIGCVLLRWDTTSTRRALDDLHAAKYEHKSL